MTKYEKVRDWLICQKNDIIDNASFNLIKAILEGEDRIHKIDKLYSLVGGLLPRGYSPNLRGKEWVEILENLEELVGSFNLSKDSLEWNMEYIAQVTETVKNTLDNKCFDTCHAYFMQNEDVKEDDPNYDKENDGILCCLSCERCKGCPEPKELEV